MAVQMLTNCSAAMFDVVWFEEIIPFMFGFAAFVAAAIPALIYKRAK